MSQTWLTALDQLWEETPTAPPWTWLAEGGGVVPLSAWALMAARGEEAVDFLHRQLSSDVAGLPQGRSQLSSYNSPKGRVLALFRLFHAPAGAGIDLRLPAELMAPTLQRLRMFILRSKLTLEASEAVGLGLLGEAATACLAERFELPQTAEEVTCAGACRLLRVPGPLPRFELWGPHEEVLAVAGACRQAGLARLHPEAWELAEIQAGLPEVYEATREAFVPQMLNLHRLGGVSFQKGCYPGQEVVARMHYLGKLKRRLFRFQVAGTPPSPGTPVRDPEGQTQGQVVRAARADEGHSEGLAVLALAAVTEARPLQLPEARPLELLPLPYEVDDRA